MRNSIGLCCVILACLALQTVNYLSTRQADRGSAPDAQQKARDASWNEDMAEFQKKAAQLDREFAETRQAAEQGDAAWHDEAFALYTKSCGAQRD
jgi:hypothetical protein